MPVMNVWSHHACSFRHSSSLIKNAGTLLQEGYPKRIILSGPSGFLGQRVLECILKVHQHRMKQGIKPGEVWTKFLSISFHVHSLFSV